MTRTRRAWVDIITPPDVHFFAGLLRGLEDTSFSITVRENGQTVPLTRELGLPHRVVGRDFDNTTLRKVGIPLRTAQLALAAPDCDVSLSFRDAMCILASKVHRVPSIHFTDNDITAHVDGLEVEELYNRLEAMATYNVVPSAFATEELTQWGADPSSVYTFDGYKEDVSVADFRPDPSFADQFPFEEYVVLRPEALTAAYVDADSLAPEILERAVDRGFNVVYLPRGRGDESFASGYPNDRVFVPDSAVHGLQLAWHAQCVLTGSGTMAREAASMNKPAVSFFPSALLSVDRALVDEGRVLHSRDPVEIVDYLDSLTESEVEPDLTRAREARDECVAIVSTLMDSV